jgi:hypothetical protein
MLFSIFSENNKKKIKGKKYVIFNFVKKNIIFN